MSEVKKLNIHLKFSDHKKEIRTQRVKKNTNYVYHWPRIITIALVTVFILSSSIYSLNNYFNPPVPTIQLADKKTPPPITVQPLIKNESSAKPVPLTETKNDSPDTAPVLSKAPTTLFSQSDIQIFSPNIKRFVIAQRIKNREPIGTIDDIKFDHNNIATVYAFSDAQGLVNETLYYKWNFNGKQIARVRVGVGSDHWRSYSRKYIQPHMHGDWSVILENKKGKILASSHFHY